MRTRDLGVQQLQNIVLIQEGNIRMLNEMLSRNKVLFTQKISLNECTADLEKHIEELEDLLHRTRCSYFVVKSQLDLLKQEIGLAKE
jgi:hypothetical protein